MSTVLWKKAAHQIPVTHFQGENFAKCGANYANYVKTSNKLKIFFPDAWTNAIYKGSLMITDPHNSFLNQLHLDSSARSTTAPSHPEEMATHMDKVNDFVRSHLDGSEVTKEEFDEYLKVVREGHARLREKWLLKWPQFERELVEWIETGKNFYFRFETLSAIATYKKLVPEESKRDMNGLYWAIWVFEMMNVVLFIIDDIVDESELRYNIETVHRKIGSGSAICISMYVLSALGGILDEKFANLPYAYELREVHREMFQKILMGVVMDAPGPAVEDRRQRMSSQWHTDRALYGCAHALWYPFQIAFLLAGEPIDSDAGTTAWKLAQIAGEVGRAADDVCDLADGTDVADRFITWTAMKVKEVDDQSFEDHYINHVEGTQEKMENLHRQMDFQNVFKKYELEQRAKFKSILEAAPAQLPKATCQTMYDFVGKFWVDFCKFVQKQ